MDNLESLEDLTSLWTFDESLEDVERQLQRVTNELAEAKTAAIEQGKSHKENVKKLIHLLSIVYKERDEARDQLHKLMMSKTKMTSQSNVSSSSSLDNVIASADNLSSCGSSYDRGSAIIENLANRRPRPEKGKLLQSVMEAGPLLDTLLVAGSLPQWRDPPPITQAHQVPPVPIKGYKTQAQTQAPQAQIIGVANNVLDTPSMSSTTNMLNFGGALSGSYLVHGAMGFSHQTTMGKRQRIQ